MKTDSAKTISKPLRKFFRVEIRNEQQGGIGPATLNSALDSLMQAPADVIASWSGGGTLQVLQTELTQLRARLGGTAHLANLV